MRRSWVLGVVVAWAGLLSAAGQTPFERVTIDDSVKDPWAKIIADIDILGANWSGPYQPVELWENRPLVGLWFGDWEYVVPIRVGAAGFDREISVVEVPLDLTRMLAQLGRTAPGGDPEFRILEAAIPRQKRQDVVSFQFEKASDYDPRTALKGTLIFTLVERMGAQAAQGFHI